ncbi:ATP-binding cassette domain-containing protein [Pararhodobacter sp. SW119]|uniref:ATP-binding cassette domain-containing protein n=1 Tax=Pararhodobacter sp. SW119 TaxID=2780075 RepID=UPI001ADF9CC8|nr:ATP-binding cassette domain-containing protein [Pararhodobacter sp. SW119]
MDDAIATDELVKVYGTTRALDGVSLRVPRGQVCGLLGPNGAGKTTFVRVLSTLIRPTGGRAILLGHDVVADPGAVRARISLTGQFASVDEDLTGRENLMLLARLLGLSGVLARARCAELLEAFELTDAAGRQVRGYSGGMRRRLDIAASMIARPELLFLDEPTTGLDPRARADVWAIIRRLARSGTTVLLTTQYLEEADQLAERIAVIDHGRVIAEGTAPELKARVGSGVLRLTLRTRADAAQAVGIASRLGLEAHGSDDPRLLEVPLTDGAAALPLLSALAAEGIPPLDFAYGQPSLDAVFFALTGHGADHEHEVTP